MPRLVILADVVRVRPIRAFHGRPCAIDADADNHGGGGPIVVDHSPAANRQDFSGILEPSGDTNDEEFNQVRSILKSWQKKHTTSSIEPTVKELQNSPADNNTFGLYKFKQTLKLMMQADGIKIDHDDDDDQCSICLEKLWRRKGGEEQLVKLLRCKHVFHRTCIFSWLPRKNSCPYCRTSSLSTVTCNFVRTSCGCAPLKKRKLNS